MFDYPFLQVRKTKQRLPRDIINHCSNNQLVNCNVPKLITETNLYYVKFCLQCKNGRSLSVSMHRIQFIWLKQLISLLCIEYKGCHLFGKLQFQPESHYKLSHHSLYFSAHLFVKSQKVTKIICSQTKEI